MSWLVKAKAAEAHLTADMLRSAISYCPDTGVFTWIKPRTRNDWIGKEAGTVSRLGYRSIIFGTRRYQAHRLAWLYVHGRWPEYAIDHINGNPGDNRIFNLRECTYSQNSANAKIRSNNTSGFKGVSWSRKRNKWIASLTINGRPKNLGGFETREEASAFREMISKQVYGEFASDGVRANA